VQRSGLESNWSNIVAIFSIWLWTVVGIFMLVCSICLYYFVRNEGLRNENLLWAFITTLCFSIGIYGPYEPKKGYIRVYIGCLLLYGMHFSAGEEFDGSISTRSLFEFHFLPRSIQQLPSKRSDNTSIRIPSLTFISQSIFFFITQSVSGRQPSRSNRRKVLLPRRRKPQSSSRKGRKCLRWDAAQL
jgi:hypothetical protein